MDLVVDIETRDPGLTKHGPSIYRPERGEVLYCSTYDGREAKTYGGPGAGWDIRYPELLAQLADPKITKIFHNGMYDLNWLINGLGIEVNGRTKDTMSRASLLNEYAQYEEGRGAGYSLAACCYREGVQGKTAVELQDWWKEHGGQGSVYDHIKEVDPEVAVTYAEQDCKATWDLFQAQQPQLEAQDLLRIEEIDDKMYKPCLKLYKTGIRIDDKRREEVAEAVRKKECRYAQEMGEWGLENSNGRKELTKKFIELDLLDQLEETDKHQPSFSSESLAGIDHPLCRAIIKRRECEKLLSTYLEGQLVEYNIDGRIHPQFHPSFGEDGGAKTGRMSCSHPNLQNIPKMKDFYKVRSIFLPEEGCTFVKSDYSQIEYTILAHYAVMCNAPGALDLQEKMRQGVKYHKLVQEMLGWTKNENQYTMVKCFNFGSVYGLGLDAFVRKFWEENLESAHELGLTVPEYCSIMREEYFAKAPFVRPTTQWIQGEGRRLGYVRSLDGRKHRNPPRMYNPRTKRIESAMYKLPNYIIQGGASGIFKLGVIATWEAGIWDVLPMHLLVHDEMDSSNDGSKTAKEAHEELKNLMEGVMELEVPIRVGVSEGPTWQEEK